MPAVSCKIHDTATTHADMAATATVVIATSVTATATDGLNHRDVSADPPPATPTGTCSDSVQTAEDAGGAASPTLKRETANFKARISTEPNESSHTTIRRGPESSIASRAAALALFGEGIKPKEIETKCGISRVAFAKLLGRARKRGYVPGSPVQMVHVVDAPRSGRPKKKR